MNDRDRHSDAFDPEPRDLPRSADLIDDHATTARDTKAAHARFLRDDPVGAAVDPWVDNAKEGAA